MSHPDLENARLRAEVEELKRMLSQGNNSNFQPNTGDFQLSASPAVRPVPHGHGAVPRSIGILPGSQLPAQRPSSQTHRQPVSRCLDTLFGIGFSGTSGSD